MKKRIVLIVQARMGSRRLPGKTLMDLAGAPLLTRILERLKRCRRLDDIVVATTERPEDDRIEKLTCSVGAISFRGSENDLLERYLHAARATCADMLVRFPADNPVPEPAEIDRIIDHHLLGASDFSSNLAQVFGNGYPDGIGAEVFDRKTLESVATHRPTSEQREHIHLNFFDYRLQQPVFPDRWRVGTVPCPAAFRRPDLVLDVNTLEQYHYLAALYAYLYPRNPHFSIVDIIAWHDQVYRREVGGTPIGIPPASKSEAAGVRSIGNEGERRP